MAGFGGLPIGLALAAVNLIGIPLTGTSVNPARSLGPAIFAGGAALTQLWLFIVAPLVGRGAGGGRAPVTHPRPRAPRCDRHMQPSGSPPPLTAHGAAGPHQAVPAAQPMTGPVNFSPGPCPGSSGTAEASRKASCSDFRPSRSGAAW